LVLFWPITQFNSSLFPFRSINCLLITYTYSSPLLPLHVYPVAHFTRLSYRFGLVRQVTTSSSYNFTITHDW
jgi:hypothetical protein